MPSFDPSIFPRSAVEGASRVPAYALGVLIVIALVFAVPQLSLAPAMLLAVTFLALFGFVVWVIEIHSKRSVSTTSPGQTERLQEVRDLDKPIRSVFENLVGDDDVFVVYSSTDVKEFVNQLAQTVRPADDPTFGGPAERRVTTIPDAFGAAKIHNLLYLGGKRDRLRPRTSWPDDFNSDSWDASLILIGSGRSNRATTQALDEFGSPYRFSKDFDAIV
ncbi:MAG: hypothetical protein QOG42_1648, partial [Solirubrobacteraceae bacterium]|nr:hypothetical protein [Solirubrobacteraceae bacterium]